MKHGNRDPNNPNYIRGSKPYEEKKDKSNTAEDTPTDASKVTPSEGESKDLEKASEGEESEVVTNDPNVNNEINTASDTPVDISEVTTSGSESG